MHRAMYVVATQKALDFQKYFGEIFAHLTNIMFHGFSEEEKTISFTFLKKVISQIMKYN